MSAEVQTSSDLGSYASPVTGLRLFASLEEIFVANRVQVLCHRNASELEWIESNRIEYKQKTRKLYFAFDK